MRDTRSPRSESREEAAEHQRAALRAPARQLWDTHSEKEDGKTHRKFLVARCTATQKSSQVP